MAAISIKCPKCNNLCTFQDGRLFSFCNKCGSGLQRDIGNHVSLYNKEEETDENILFVSERFEVCSSMKIPTRADHDVESLNYEIERMMDEFMTFVEVEKDVLSSLDSMPDDTRVRVCEQCATMIDRLFMQFEQFLKEYNDFGMYDEMRSTRDAFLKKQSAFASEMSAIQNKAANDYWKDRPEELAQLKAKLEDAKLRRTKVLFYDFQKKWAIDNEIEELESQLNRIA